MWLLFVSVSAMSLEYVREGVPGRRKQLPSDKRKCQALETNVPRSFCSIAPE
jgi:hypothetical protein